MALNYSQKLAQGQFGAYGGGMETLPQKKKKQILPTFEPMVQPVQAAPMPQIPVPIRTSSQDPNKPIIKKLAPTTTKQAFQSVGEPWSSNPAEDPFNGPIKNPGEFGTQPFEFKTSPDTIQNLANVFQANQPQISPINYQNVSGEFAGFRPPTMERPQMVSSVSGLPADYFASKKQQLMDDLRKEFFGQGGQYSQTLADESAAGRLGSGVGDKRIQRLSIEPFAEQTRKIGQDVFQQELTERARVESVNKEIDAQNITRLMDVNKFNAGQIADYQKSLADLRLRDSGNKLVADQANARLAADLQQMALDAAKASAGLLSAQDTAMLEAQTRAYEAGIQAYQKQVEAAANYELQAEQNRIDLFNAMSNKNLTPEQTQLAEEMGVEVPKSSEEAISNLPKDSVEGSIATGIDGNQYIYHNNQWYKYTGQTFNNPTGLGGQGQKQFGGG